MPGPCRAASTSGTSVAFRSRKQTQEWDWSVSEAPAATSGRQGRSRSQFGPGLAARSSGSHCDTRGPERALMKGPGQSSTGVELATSSYGTRLILLRVARRHLSALAPRYGQVVHVRMVGACADERAADPAPADDPTRGRADRPARRAGLRRAVGLRADGVRFPDGAEPERPRPRCRRLAAGEFAPLPAALPIPRHASASTRRRRWRRTSTALDTFHDLTAPADWLESLVKAYVGDGIAARLLPRGVGVSGSGVPRPGARGARRRRPRGVRRRSGAGRPSPPTPAWAAGWRCGRGGWSARR